MTTKSFLFDQEPLWLANRRGMRHKLPVSVQSWTYEAGSLTQRLRNIHGGSVAVKILLHQWRTPFLTERRLLKLPQRQCALIREVLLHVDGKPLILARTIIPATTIQVARSNLSHLGTRPLGEIIFSYPNLERRALAITLIPPAAWTQSVTGEADITQPVWGRRTVYAIAHKQMLVNEFFLPEIL